MDGWIFHLGAMPHQEKRWPRARLNQARVRSEVGSGFALDSASSRPAPHECAPSCRAYPAETRLYHTGSASPGGQGSRTSWLPLRFLILRGVQSCQKTRAALSTATAH